MLKAKGMFVCLIVAGLVLSVGGCVSKSKYDKVVMELGQTRGTLDQLQIAKQTLDAQYEQSRLDNSRLRDGIGGVAESCNATVQRVKSAEGTLAKLKANERRAEACLAELQQMLARQAATLSAFERVFLPLHGELDDMRNKAASLTSKTNSTAMLE